MPPAIMLQSCQVPFREFFLEVEGGERLRIRVSELPLPVRAELVLTHGLGEHCRRYEHVASALAEHGVRVWKYDLRGHGRSGGSRGDVRDYQAFVDDLREVMRVVRRDGSPGAPLFLFGHSFGGQVTIRFLEQGQFDVAGAIIASPWLRLAFRPAWWRMILARLSMWICPGRPHSSPTSIERMSRDMAHVLAMPELELTHRRISPRMFFAIQKQGRQALAEAARVRVPLLLLHGDADSVTCHRATRDFHTIASSPDKTLKIYEGALHETHNDLCRQQVIEDICAWLEAHLPPRA
jgi:alpha-beta hydrolase superfamily lysophospholipase